ncbi:helix-turn-helix domain-containing protein [Streptomyces albus]|uniref:helix-turn-helix domain-containing protein n=1 Tax=Streptomyces albus TaxID=1888 RepID=UPI001ABF80D4|nr:AraC family transcriptional regulator [Streptomyces albus]
MARTTAHHEPIAPTAFDFVRVTVVRSGSAILLSEFGQKPVNIGDVALFGANTLCGIEPENHITMTAIYLDADYVVDQVFWQHVGILRDRQDAREFVETAYTEPAQILRLGEDRAGMLMPWLDELVALSVQSRPVDTFYRTQALWFSVAHVIAPFVRTSPVRTSSTERTSTWPAAPRHRQFAPLRVEAQRVAELLRADPARRWSVTELARAVHLSKSQLGRVFVEAYGKSPIAYLTMLRTERMAALLRTTDTPIARIAHDVGWADPDFASRQFRRSVGITPSHYRTLSCERAAPATG